MLVGIQRISRCIPTSTYMHVGRAWTWDGKYARTCTSCVWRNDFSVVLNPSRYVLYVEYFYVKIPFISIHSDPHPTWHHITLYIVTKFFLRSNDGFSWCDRYPPIFPQLLVYRPVLWHLYHGCLSLIGSSIVKNLLCLID